eukprot:jgi/Bigna1/132963/aug1.19_g7671
MMRKKANLTKQQSDMYFPLQKQQPQNHAPEGGVVDADDYMYKNIERGTCNGIKQRPPERKATDTDKDSEEGGEDDEKPLKNQQAKNFHHSSKFPISPPQSTSDGEGEGKSKSTILL